MIPAQAVEAALVALDEAWITDASREQLRGMMQAALEAAAPYIRAQALDQVALDLDVAPYETLDCGAVINDWRDALNVNHGIQAATRFISGRAEVERPAL